MLDAYSRRIVGWSMATTLAKQLVLDALNMALATRRPRGVLTVDALSTIMLLMAIEAMYPGMR